MQYDDWVNGMTRREREQMIERERERIEARERDERELRAAGVPGWLARQRAGTGRALEGVKR